ncbi:hypothetical protein [Corynebacterium terpenotabidum]|uniref:Secreted protein n=1 Tax=Corynebacterium terpenotabidum Y-11 TaxID=1200352 RepID=S4XH76_9CORY|nr:hypothetical protein [Corynebacterium terpenotabidum]AGP29993.1 hypothetical protein A606_01690 [Corynebacterium terpenotabidum Y-11]
MSLISRRLTGLAALATAVALTLSACGSDDNGSDSSGSPSNGTDAADADAQTTDNLRNLYRDVLAQVSTDDFADATGPTIDFTGDFQYATADLNADAVPELLVKATGQEFSPIRVYSASDDGTQLIAPTKIFYEGASSAGGSRAAVYTTSDGSGLLQADWMGGTGAANSTLWSFDGSEMTESGRTWSYRIDQVPSDLASLQTDITWISTDDSSALDTLSIGGTAQDAASDSGPQPTTGGDAGSGTSDSGSAGSAGTLPQSMTASSSQIGGTCGTVDGVTVTAGDSTSCGFAMNVAQQLLSTGWGPGRAYVPSDPTSPTSGGSTTVTATSPSTGTTYTMDCNMNQDGRGGHCEGGNGASVGLVGSLTRYLQAR